MGSHVGASASIGQLGGGAIRFSLLRSGSAGTSAYAPGSMQNRFGAWNPPILEVGNSPTPGEVYAGLCVSAPSRTSRSKNPLSFPARSAIMVLPRPGRARSPISRA